MLEEIGISVGQRFGGLVDESWVRRIAQHALEAEGVAPPYEVTLVFTNEAYEPNKTIFAGANARTILFLTSSKIPL